MRTAARVTLFALASSLGLGTLRVTASAEPARAANDRPNGSDRGGPALREIGEEIARSAFGLAPGAAVIGLAPTTPNLGPGIAVRLAVRVALALGNGAAAWPYVETERHAIALPHGARPLVLLTPRLDGDRLVVTAEVIGPETPGAAQKLLHGIATRALDAEVRSFLPAVRLAAREIIPLSGADSDVLALACSDVLGRGDPVLATLGRARVTLGTLTQNRFVSLETRRLAELAPVAPIPLREPLASVVLGGNGELSLGISDRAFAVRFGPDARGAKLGAPEPLAGARLPWPGGGCAHLEALFVAPDIQRCTKNEPAPNALPRALAEPLDALAGATVVARSGEARVVRAGRAADATVRISDGTRDASLARAGAALAIGDLDGDGVPELLTSLDTLDPAADALVVYTWPGGPELREMLRVPVSHGIKAIAVCPERASAMAPVVVATNHGLWVVR